MPAGCVPFTPIYIKYNLDGLPQYLNGTANGTKGGIGWYDFDKFGWELSKQGGTEAVMDALIKRGIAIPAVITAVSDQGLYSLSLYESGLPLCDLLQWDGSRSADEISPLRRSAELPDVDSETLFTGTVTSLLCVPKCNVQTGQKEPFLQRAEAVTEDGILFRIGKAELAKVPAISEGCRVRFREKVNTNPNAADTRYACDVELLDE